LSKRSIKKKTPIDADPAGSPVLLASGGTPKNSLALRQFWCLIPPPALLLGGIKRGDTLCTLLVQVRVFQMTLKNTWLEKKDIVH